MTTSIIVFGLIKLLSLALAFIWMFIVMRGNSGTPGCRLILRLMLLTFVITLYNEGGIAAAIAGFLFLILVPFVVSVLSYLITLCMKIIYGANDIEIRLDIKKTYQDYL